MQIVHYHAIINLTFNNNSSGADNQIVQLNSTTNADNVQNKTVVLNPS